MTAKPALLFALGGVAVLALAATARTLGGGLLSDDLLLDFFTRHDAPGMQPDWARVAADFGRPWLGIPAPLYRPMVSLSMASDLAIDSGSHAAFHLTNTALHALIAVLVGALCAQFVTSRRALAALVGGGLVALHPAAIEPVAWIAARNSSLELAFHATALLGFACWLRRPTNLARAFALTGAVLALASKESAVVLPVSLLAVDFLVRDGLPLRGRLRAHLVFVPIWLAYLVLRLALFGGLSGGDGTASETAPLAALASKVVATLAPTCGSTPLLELSALPLWVAAAFVVSRQRRVALLTVLIWFAAHCAPSWRLGVGAELGGARLVYGALLPLAALAACATARSPRTMACLALLGSIGFAVGGQRIVTRYVDAWHEIDGVAAGVREHADEARPGRPLVVTAVPPTRPGLPPFNHNGWFALGSGAVQTEPIGVFSAGYVTAPTPGAEELHHDGAALAMLWEHGCTILTWQPETVRFLARRRPTGAYTLPALAPDPSAPHTWRFAEPAPADRLGAVTIRTQLGAQRGRLAWETGIANLPAELAGLDFGPGEAEGDETVFHLDLARALGLPSLATFGVPITALSVTFSDEVEVVAVEAGTRVPELPLGDRYDGASLDLASFAARTSAPVARADAELRLVVQTAMGAVVVPCTTGSPVTVTPALRDALEVLNAASRDRTILYWFEARATQGRAGTARSQIDHFVLAPDRV